MNTNPDDSAFRYVEIHEGLTKLEYAAIHIAAGLSANSNFGHELSCEKIAQVAVNQAKALFEELNK